MRKIRKSHAPRSLTRWAEDNKELDHDYGALLGSPAHHDLKNKLLTEQGYLCAYTGLHIDDGSSHVEHIKPQSICGEWEDVDYRNVVACFPKSGGDESYGYGAPIKGAWWSDGEFISPCNNGCEQRFKFNWSGKVGELPNGHPAAVKTIKVLNLNEDKLKQLRRSAIKGFFGFGHRSRSKPLSKAEAQQILGAVDVIDGGGKLREFCFVFKQLIPRYLAEGGA